MRRIINMDQEKKKPLHVLVVTYEFTFSPFSGNGILARSLVKSLLEHGCRVTVWCCRPHQHAAAAEEEISSTMTNSSDHHLEPPEISTQQAEQLQVHNVQLSPENGWKRLDDESAWQDFVWNNLDDSQQELFNQALQTVDIRCAIDWTGAHAVRSIPTNIIRSSNQQQQQQDNGKRRTRKDTPSLPFMYLNFRVYSSGVPDESKHKWYDDMERMALMEADSIVALSHKDVASLKVILGQGIHNDNDIANNNSSNNKEIHVLLPPLRNDMERLALSNNPTELVTQHLPPRAADAIANCNSHNPAAPASPALPSPSQQERVFVTCVVRLSPEKEAMRFVDFIQANQDLFQKNNYYIALLAGATGDVEYAARIHERLQEIVQNNPACRVIVLNDSFLSPPSLAAVFMRTALNFHPCSYDAYGMTVIEAADFGVPSVIASGTSVGASAIVGNDGSRGGAASIPVDFASNNGDNWHGTVRDALSRPQELQEIGAVARHHAFSWDETAYGAKLLEYMEIMMEKASAA